ncbi:MAG: hypothetical protein KDI15_02675 [Thiothrix sp.]|nr:hypothetical protein [Thiothrix sp.]HPE62198.1 hypothetical protein [Thiolinea sp.]
MQPAYTAGPLRPHAAQLRLSALPVSADPDFSFPTHTDLSYSHTPNGVLVTYAGLLVAWIYPGHAGSRSSNRCTFWDVACPGLSFGEQGRVTGILLDNLSFDTLTEAVQHIEATFGTGGAA